MEANLARLPVSLTIEVRAPLQLALFLAAVRGLADSAAPGALVWETREHRGREYVGLSASDPARMPAEDLCVHHAILPERLVFSLREDLLQRSIECALDDDEAHAERVGRNAVIAARGGLLRLLGPVLESTWARRARAGTRSSCTRASSGHSPRVPAVGSTCGTTSGRRWPPARSAIQGSPSPDRPPRQFSNASSEPISA